MLHQWKSKQPPLKLTGVAASTLYQRLPFILIKRLDVLQAWGSITRHVICNSMREFIISYQLWKQIINSNLIVRITGDRASVPSSKITKCVKHEKILAVCEASTLWHVGGWGGVGARLNLAWCWMERRMGMIEYAHNTWRSVAFLRSFLFFLLSVFHPRDCRNKTCIRNHRPEPSLSLCLFTMDTLYL